MTGNSDDQPPPPLDIKARRGLNYGPARPAGPPAAGLQAPGYGAQVGYPGYNQQGGYGQQPGYAQRPNLGQQSDEPKHRESRPPDEVRRILNQVRVLLWVVAVTSTAALAGLLVLLLR